MLGVRERAGTAGWVRDVEADSVVLMKNDTSLKAVLDSLLLKIPGVEAADMSGLPAYFVHQRMFACIHGEGVGIRLPAAAATNLQFSKDNVATFQPRGVPATREWVQINHSDPADFRQDEEIFQASIAFVKAAKSPR